MTMRIRRGIDSRDVAGAVAAARQPGALADRDSSRCRRACRRARRSRCDDRALAAKPGTDSLENVAIVAAFNEADVLRLRLVVDRQPQTARVLARRGLIEVAERQQQSLSCCGRQLRECIRLIFGDAVAEEVRAVGAVFEASVVPGCDVSCVRGDRRTRASVPSLTKLLHETHGLGVRPLA